jgi:hypothetical protein
VLCATRVNDTSVREGGDRCERNAMARFDVRNVYGGHNSSGISPCIFRGVLNAQPRPAGSEREE